MNKKFFLIALLLTIIGRFISTPQILLYFDGPEYVDIVTNNNFFASLSLGHVPIHPVFMGIFWVIFRFFHQLLSLPYEYSANLVALLCGVFSLPLFYSLTSHYLSKKDRYISTIVFSLLPSIWIVSTNLVAESIILPLFLVAANLYTKILSKKTSSRIILLIISLILLLGAHTEMLVWLPAFFALPIVLNTNPQTIKKQLVTYLEIVIVAIIGTLMLYGIIFWFGHKTVIFEMRQLFFGRIEEIFSINNIPYDLLRALRNFGLSMLRNFSSGVIFLLIYIIFKRSRNKQFIFGLFLLIIPFFIISSVWTGDFMRRISFAGVFIALIVIKYLPRWKTFIPLYLIPIVMGNMLLNTSFRKDMPFISIRNMYAKLPAQNYLIQTHFLKPFVQYSGENLWIEEVSGGNIEKTIGNKENKVILDSQAIFAPYLLYVGNNIHITALGGFGNSQLKPLFPKYIFNLKQVEDAKARIYMLSVEKDGSSFEGRIAQNRKFSNASTRVLIGKTLPGKAVYVYSQRFADKIHRERVDYGDILTWIWVIITNRHEPLLWTYSDRDGVFVLPVVSGDANAIDIKGEDLTNVHLL